MSDEATRRAILARRARFLAAALAATVPAGACKRDPDPEIEADQAPGGKGTKPQACLKTVETAPTEATPHECLKIAPPPSDAGEPVPHPCLKVAIPEEEPARPDGGVDAGVAPASPRVEVKGSSAAEVVIAKSRWRFRRCQFKALAVDPKASGVVTVSVEIGADGKAGTVKATGGTTELAKCTSEVFSSITFSDPAGTKLTVTVTYPKG